MSDLREAAPVAASVVVARAPVVDRNREIVGFELVSRAAPAGGDGPADEASEAVVMVSRLLGSLDVDLSPVVGHKVLFCTVDRSVVLSEPRLSLPPRRTVLEVPNRDVDAELLESVGRYKQAGFTIMVQHCEWTAETEALLALADLLKIDLRSGPPAHIMRIVDRYRDVPVDLLAEGCDTEAELDWARTVGFHLFAGRAVRVNEAPSTSTSAPLPLSQVQLGVELLSRDLDLDRVEDVLRGDPALVLQLLTMASVGAGGGLRRQVRSLREALVVMGTARIRQWAALVILSRQSRRHSDALLTTLVRARMCELLARSRGLDAPFAFTAGILSALPALLGVPVREVEEQVRADEDLTAAAFRREGPVGALITWVEDHERSLDGDDQPVEDHDELMLIAAMAFGWAASYVDALDSAAAS